MISDEKLNELIDAIDELIEDRDDRKNSMWHGSSDTKRARDRFKEALRACLDQSQNG